MLYSVRVIQTLNGYINIEANSPEEAMEAADRRFNGDGESLDECNMDDFKELEFEVEN